jgi:hypothetical protein
VNGKTLAEMLQREWRYAQTGRAVVTFLYVVFAALAHLFQAYGYVHNDLSTANVLAKTLPATTSNIPAGFNRAGTQYDPATGAYTHTIVPKDVDRYVPVLIDNGRASLRPDVIEKRAQHLGNAVNPIMSRWPALWGTQDVRRLALSVFRSLAQSIDRRLKQYSQARPDQYTVVADALVQPISAGAAGELVIALLKIMHPQLVHFAVRGSSFNHLWTRHATAALGTDDAHGSSREARKLFMYHVRRYERYGRELLLFIRHAVDSQTNKPAARYARPPPSDETPFNTARMMFSFNAVSACLASIDYVLEYLIPMLGQMCKSQVDALQLVEKHHTPEAVRQWSMFHYVK